MKTAKADQRLWMSWLWPAGGTLPKSYRDDDRNNCVIMSFSMSVVSGT